MMYDLVHDLAIIKDTDHFYLREHRIVIRDTDVLSLICKENSPGRAVKHFFSPEAWRMEERSVEIFIYPETVYVQTFAFSLESLYKGDVFTESTSQHDNF